MARVDRGDGGSRRHRHRYGAFLGTRLPERAIKLFAAAMFVGFGALLVAEGLGLL
jgi:hypothetical protein